MTRPIPCQWVPSAYDRDCRTVAVATVYYPHTGDTRQVCTVHEQIMLRAGWVNELPRHASPQAWRRLRETLTHVEACDIARDIANIAECDPTLVLRALVTEDWEGKRQA